MSNRSPPNNRTPDTTPLPGKKPRTYSIVIPAWNESSHIQKTLDAVNRAKAEIPIDGEVIVVDNNSTDDTAAIAAAADARVVFEPVNKIARARNTGAEASAADCLIFVDADTIINTELLKMSLEAMYSGEVIGGGSTVAFDRDLQGVARLLVVFWNWWSVRIKAAAGCYLFCTRDAFNAVGGFDEKQYAAEELVLSKQLRQLAKQRSQQFVVFNQAPVISSARKLDWYSRKQKLQQLAILLLPGATRSKSMCTMWYDRSTVTKNDSNS